ncbi:MAG: tetratricopeptide repeat protein [Longimicrobiales bacterium]
MRPSLQGPRAPGPRAWAALAALTAVALYLRTVGFGWVYDDQMEVVLNTFVRSLANLPAIFTSTVWAGSGMETFLYRPLAVVTYALNWQLSGAEPWSYHLVNVLLHAGAAVLVVRLGTLWRLSPAAAGLAGILFAVHPIHVEAVAAVFGRKDLLATLLVLAFALAHRGALERGGWRRAAAPLLLLCAMLSKEVGVVGLALVAVQDLWLERDRRAFLARREVPLLYASHLVAVTLFLLARTSVTGGMGIPDTSFWDNPLASAPLAQRVATALVVAGKGAGLLLLPLGQSPDYSFDAIPVVTSPFDLRLLATLLGGLALVGAAVHPRLRSTVLPLALAWYALSLLPTANVLVVSGTIFAERLLYLPSVGFSLVAGAALAWAVQRRRAGGTALAVAAVVALAFGTVAYSRFWSDDVTLFRRAAAAVPGSTKAHHKLGEELLRRGELGDALRSLGRALEIAPGNVFAAETLEQARTMVVQRYVLVPAGGAPSGPEALPRDPDILLVVGATRLSQGDTTGARAALSDFLELAGDRYPAETAWARSVLARPGDPAPTG